MRKIRERRHHAGSRRYLVNERKFAGARRLSGRPFEDAGGNAAGGSKKDLSGKTSGHHKERNYRSKLDRDSRHALGKPNPKERDEWRRVVEVNLPFGGAPGKEMLEQNRRSDQQPTGSHQRQDEQRK